MMGRFSKPAKGRSPTSPYSWPPYGLRSAEAQVATDVALGKSIKLPPGELRVQPTAVRTRLENVFRKTGTGKPVGDGGGVAVVAGYVGGGGGEGALRAWIRGYVQSGRANAVGMTNILPPSFIWRMVSFVSSCENGFVPDVVRRKGAILAKKFWVPLSPSPPIDIKTYT